GNDQVRFEVALKSSAPGVQILAPVRDDAPARADQVAYLQQRGLPVPSHGAAYSVNTGLWGVTIGGKETTGTTESLPDDQWIRTKPVPGQADQTLT
ncbi:argininosuccinate synthase domain-containing protein, partial [Acinetobacter baumannii]